MHRVVIDADVLFAAAFDRDAGVRRLWDAPQVELFACGFVVEEARRNLGRGRQRRDLEQLVENLALIGEFPSAVAEPSPGAPGGREDALVRAAVRVGAEAIVVGDVARWADRLGTSVSGVAISSASAFLAGDEVRERPLFCWEPGY